MKLLCVIICSGAVLYYNCLMQREISAGQEVGKKGSTLLSTNTE